MEFLMSCVSCDYIWILIFFVTVFLFHRDYWHYYYSIYKGTSVNDFYTVPSLTYYLAHDNINVKMNVTVSILTLTCQYICVRLYIANKSIVRIIASIEIYLEKGIRFFHLRVYLYIYIHVRIQMYTSIWCSYGPINERIAAKGKATENQKVFNQSRRFFSMFLYQSRQVYHKLRYSRVYNFLCWCHIVIFWKPFQWISEGSDKMCYRID